MAMHYKLRQAILDMLLRVELVAIDAVNIHLLFRARQLRDNLQGHR